MTAKNRMNVSRRIAVTTAATVLGLLAAFSSSSAPVLPSQAQVTTELTARVADLLGAMPAGTASAPKVRSTAAFPATTPPLGPANSIPVLIVNTRSPAPAQTFLELATQRWRKSRWKAGPAESGSGVSGVDADGYRFTIEKASSGAAVSEVAPCATPTQTVPATN